MWLLACSLEEQNCFIPLKVPLALPQSLSAQAEVTQGEQLRLVDPFLLTRWHNASEFPWFSDGVAQETAHKLPLRVDTRTQLQRDCFEHDVRWRDRAIFLLSLGVVVLSGTLGYASRVSGHSHHCISRMELEIIFTLRRNIRLLLL